MSRYDWEQGCIILPRRHFRPIVDAIRAAHNTQALRLRQLVQRAYEQACNLHKLTTSPGDRRDAMDRVLAGCPTIADLARQTCYAADSRHIHAPDWKALPAAHAANPLPSAAVTIPAYGTDGYDEAVITIDAKHRSITWRVEENNRAVERARDTAVARALFHGLSSVVWTRGTGGEIAGNDEYNRDSRESGAGANYITGSYGPHANHRPSGRRPVLRRY